MMPSWLWDVTALLGVGTLATGCGMIAWPLALLVLGTALLAVAMLGARVQARRPRRRRQDGQRRDERGQDRMAVLHDKAYLDPNQEWD